MSVSTIKKSVALIALACAAAVTGSSATAAIPGQTPFPAEKIGDIFAVAQTATADGVVNDYFAPGSSVVFRAYALNRKTHKLLGASDVKFFYVTIPNQPNLKLKYDPKAKGATALMPWSATWTVPASYAGGRVDFKVFVKTKTKLKGQFVQLPVEASQLTITANPPAVLTPGPSVSAGTIAANPDVSLYVDTVNGTRPANAAPRPIGCTQTNVFKRGEQLVIRAWGADLATGDILSTENIATATTSITGQPDVTMNWGAHGGATGKVYYWTAAWNIPTDFPLGQTNLHVVYKTDSGKTGVQDYPVVIIP